MDAANANFYANAAHLRHHWRPKNKPFDPMSQFVKAPPHSIDAEQAVLGALLIDPNAWDRVVDRLMEEDFYRKDHRILFRAIAQLKEANQACDAVTLGDWLQRNQLADDAGGVVYAIELANNTPGAANVVAYAEIVREKSVLRQLLDAGSKIVNTVYEPDGMDSRAQLETAEREVFKIAEAGSRGKGGLAPLRQALVQTLDELQKRSTSPEDVTGLSTGFYDLDKATSGLQPSDLIIIAARPSMGKCLAANTEIVLQDGSVQTIEAIYQAGKAELFTLSEQFRITASAPSAYVDDGVKPTFEVTTRLGRRVESTAAHPFLTMDGWKALHELVEGDWIAVPRKLAVFGSQAMRECEVNLLAYLLGDGGLTGNTPRFTASNPVIRDDFLSSVGDFGGVVANAVEKRAGFAPTWQVAAEDSLILHNRQVFSEQLNSALAGAGRSAVSLARSVGVSKASISYWRAGRQMPDTAMRSRIFKELGGELEINPAAPLSRRHDPNPMTLWLRQLGVMGSGEHSKTIPKEVFQLPKAQLAQFINRLFATDGWASVLKSGQAQLGFSSVSERMARQLQHLLLRFGVIAKLRQRAVKYKETRRVAWQLDITDANSIATFAAEIGIKGKEPALAAVVAATANKRSQSNVDLIPVQVWDKIARAKAGLSWTELARRSGYNDSNSHVGMRALSRTHLARIALVLHNHAPSALTAELSALAHSDVYWDRIESIVATGAQQVYDLTIPETHNFIANDICVHNTSFVMNIAEYASLKSGRSVAVFSMEMSTQQLALRTISSLGRIRQDNLRSGRLAEEEWPRITSTLSLLRGAKLFIDDEGSLSPAEVRARARRLKREHGLGLIVVDYIQLMVVPGTSENRTNEVSEISRSLKAMAKELSVPVIALSQLNRAVEQRTDKRPMMSDLRESGSIEQDADIVAFIYRDDYYNKESTEKGVAEIIIAKHRNGPTGTVKLKFTGMYTRFDNLEQSRGI